MRKISFERSKGFTLVELMVVIAIIGILAVAALGIVRGAQQRAKTAAIQATATNISTALETYYTSAGEYPSDLHEMVEPEDDVNKVLDKDPSVPSGCSIITDQSGDYEDIDTCGIAYSSEGCSVDNQCYHIYQIFANGEQAEITGGQS